MNKADLRFDLPQELIAQQPCADRSHCRLMVLDRSSRTIDHRAFGDLPGLLRPGDLLVLNRSKVLPARFEAYRQTGGRIDGLFVRQLDQSTWQVLLRGKGRLQPGDRLGLAAGRWAMTLQTRGQRGLWTTSVEPAESPEKILQQIGQMPLPPYIHRDRQDPRRPLDRDWYQTVYAREPGSVAAPTAGLHFTEELLRRLQELGIGVAYVTLHVGLGTFHPVQTDSLAEHKMHSEDFELSEEIVEQIDRTRTGKGRVVAVGTTSVRVLETCSDESGRLSPQNGSTDIFIYPPYRFRCVDALITNFHLPESTLLALVFAFAGRDFVLDAYHQAVRQQYRFFSYGDAMLIL